MDKKNLNIAKMGKKWRVKFSPCIYKIYRISPKSIPFSIIPNLFCQNCGGFKRKISCLPFAMPYYKWRERVKKYKFAYVVIGKANGTTMIYDEGDKRMKNWKSHPNYFGHALVGVNISMQTYLYVKLLDIKKNIINQGKKCIVFVPGPCRRCRKCNIGGKCIHKQSNISGEGAGMDIYKLLEQLDIKYEYPVQNYLTAVGLVLIR